MILYEQIVPAHYADFSVHQAIGFRVNSGQSLDIFLHLLHIGGGQQTGFGLNIRQNPRQHETAHNIHLFGGGLIAGIGLSFELLVLLVAFQHGVGQTR